MIEGRIYPDVNPRICVGNEVGGNGEIVKVAVVLSKCYSNNYAKIEMVADNNGAWLLKKYATIPYHLLENNFMVVFTLKILIFALIEIFLVEPNWF